MTSGSSEETASPIVSDLSATPGPEVVVTPSAPPKARAERHADAGDLVLGLHRRHAVALEGRERVQDVGGRGDRIRPEHQRQAGPVRGGDQPSASAALPVMLR
jgi:hypothetical protein